ncbi:hypothetical protein GDO81_018542 [Engystomops pustulosus]|uniref:Uncharacterized protein n=1 Tax=Engystomops pustulosus TaxID=76066 RepID=A0AAV6ZC57_ENGPU|nr:hypothetical protein GDO81_018542 [Engystomops pustulosus]
MYRLFCKEDTIADVNTDKTCKEPLTKTTANLSSSSPGSGMGSLRGMLCALKSVWLESMLPAFPMMRGEGHLHTSLLATGITKPPTHSCLSSSAPPHRVQQSQPQQQQPQHRWGQIQGNNRSKAPSST